MACILVVEDEPDIAELLVTALDTEADQLKGYDLAADDYVTKPFSMPILLRKVDAVLRRSAAGPAASPTLLCHGPLCVDTDGHRVTAHGRDIPLTSKEFALLVALLENRGRVLTRDILLDRLWPGDLDIEYRNVDTHIKNLRRKLGMDCIHTIRGAGYRMEAETC